MKIQAHYGHEIVVAQYTNSEGEPENFAIECMDCDEVIFDEDVNE